MSNEFLALQHQGMWSLVPPPVKDPILGCKWTFKTKLLPNGQIDRYKARLVAQGFNQTLGVNYTETFSHVAKKPTIRDIARESSTVKELETFTELRREAREAKRKHSITRAQEYFFPTESESFQLKGTCFPMVASDAFAALGKLKMCVSNG
ncbi:uncharacterized protein LOC110093683 [Dendrobium catenatum]|uniref:uncharacterized protein LOC110093683 n=1 Tax=Dendrobium catenatum TaxID=906689 RepID=UPI0009F5F850|nr:uncharacterized protein LOC110093683 [Dendrobium catenatum]